VRDVVSATTFTNDIDNQSPANYKYDKTGNLIEDVSESTRIHWTYYNKVKQIDSVKLTPPKYGLILGTKLRMKYDALGNRVVKEVPKKKQKEIYVRDAQGNVIALYEVKQDSLYSKEFYIYGSQRLGYLEDEVFLGKRCTGKFCNIVANPANPMPFIGTQKTLPTLPPVVIQPISSSSVSIVFGKKRYELSDWLGNVRVVINDRKTPINSGNATVGYKAQVVSVSDYYSFGSEIAERTYEVVKPLYRFGFQAQEKDNEIYGKGNTYYFKFREHDARIGRFWSVDPLAAKYPHYSPYQFSGNRLTDMVELEGLEPKEAGKEVGETREAPQVGQEGQGNKLWGWTGSEWGYSAPEVTVEGSKMSESNSSVSIPINQGKDVSSISSSAPWMDVAIREIGVKENKLNNKPGSNSRIIEYLKSTGLKGDITDQTPWCAAFVHWSLSKVGIKGAGASGKSYENWGIHLDEPKYGAVAIFNTRHVGFYFGEDIKKGYVKILHGNWSDRVIISTIKSTEIKEYRYPIINFK
jgi:uncharacterized protein (TIGR02594 family)